MSDQGVSQPYQCYAFADQVGRIVTDEFLDAVWSEMPDEWTDVGSETLSLETVKGILLREAF